MNKKLIYHFYTFDGFKENRAIKNHLKCLKRYHDVFDDALFVISVDDLDNKALIEDTKGKIIECGFKNVNFAVRQNNKFREAQTFYDEVIGRLDTFDGLVFFAHTKGVSNYEQFPEDGSSLDAWICGLYYLNLNFISETEEFLNGFLPKMFYGAFLHVDETEVNLKNVPGYYQGAIFWLNPSTILKGLEMGVLPRFKVYPTLDERDLAESYPGSLCFWRSNGTYDLGSHKLKATFLHNPYKKGKEIAKFLCDDSYEDFLKLLNDNNNDMKYLTQLANKFKTDKGTVQGWAHGYTEIYEDFFNKVKEINILEIGVWEGGSLRMLKEFFGDNANIYGVDIDEKRMFSEPGITTFVADQSSHKSLSELKKKLEGIKFDIIIDDGNHTPKDQMTTIFELHDLLKADGIYIIEDLHSNIGDTYKDIFSDTPLYFLNFFKPSKFLTEEENNELLSAIKDVKLFSTFNPLEVSSKVRHRSITSIITFK